MTSIALFSLIPLLILCINLLTWNRPTGVASFSGTRVSVLIPVRNEEMNIETCIDHIYAGRHTPYEVIVYNDNSTDRTSSILKTLKERYPSLHILQGGPLPQGWAGKNHACHHLSQQAKGDVLLFLDADTKIQPDGIGHLLNAVESERLPSDMVSALPKQLMKTWGEKMLMPFLPLTILAWLPLEFVRRFPFPSMTVAIGQVVMIRKEAYQFSGGFEAIPAELVDDMALATRFKKLGLTVRFIDGFEIAHCRMYDSIQTIWNGFSKNMFLGLRQIIPLWLFTICLYTTCFILPFILLACTPLMSSEVQLLTFLSVGFNFALRWLMVIRYSHSFLYSLLHPFASAVVVGIFINSGIQTLLGNVHWKGRTYDNVNS